MVNNGKVKLWGGFDDHFVAETMSCWFESASVLVGIFYPWCKRNNFTGLSTGGRTAAPQKAALIHPDH